MNLALWAAKTGLDAQNTRMSVISNNLANPNTTGFKAGRAAFQDLMYQNIRQVGAQSTQNTQYSTGLTLGTGVRIVATEKDYSQGSVLQTNNSLDMSVNGRGFLQITMPDGTIAYTRDGAFSLDNQGNVVTASGYPLQPAINIPAASQAVRAMSPACEPIVSVQPSITSSTAAGSTPDRSMSAPITCAPRSALWTPASAPFRRITGDRTASTRNASAIAGPPLPPR